MENSILIQNVTLSDLERIINKAIDKRISEFYESVREKPRVLIKRKDAAKLLGVSLPTVDAYSKSGIIHAIHIGGRVFFDESEIQSFNGLG